MRFRIYRRVLTAFLFAVLGCVSYSEADAAYPDHPIQVIVPYPPGGSLDVAARLLAPRMSSILGVPLVLVSKAGASGAVGMEYLKNAPADGYTLAITFNTTMTLINLYTKGLGYTYQDFVALGNFASDVDAIVVKADAKWQSLTDLIADAAKNPGKLNYGSGGVGSVSTVAMEVIKAERGLDVTNVPFVGSPPVNVAVLGRQVDFGTVAFSSAVPLIRAGELRALGISGTHRSAKFPDIPTFREQDLKNVDLSLKAGLYAGAKTPQPIVDKLAAAFVSAMQEPMIVQQLESAGLFVQVESATAAQEAIAREDQDMSDLRKMLKLPH